MSRMKLGSKLLGKSLSLGMLVVVIAASVVAVTQMGSTDIRGRAGVYPCVQPGGYCDQTLTCCSGSTCVIPGGATIGVCPPTPTPTPSCTSAQTRPCTMSNGTKGYQICQTPLWTWSVCYPLPTPTPFCKPKGTWCPPGYTNCCAGLRCVFEGDGYSCELPPTPTPTPPSVAGKSCTTRVGWPGTCTLIMACNLTNLNTAWDILGPPCNGVSKYGCCGKKPIPTPTPTRKPTPTPTPAAIRIVKITSGTCQQACLTIQGSCTSVGYDANGMNGQIMSYGNYTSCATRAGKCASTVISIPSGGVKCSGSLPEWTNCQCKMNPFAG